MKSATLAIAGYSLFVIGSQIWNGNTVALLKIPAWIASLWIAWLTYNNVSVLSNLTSYYATGWDTLFLFAKTPIEFLLFQVLVYDHSWYAWPLVHGLIAAVSHVKIRRFLSVMKDEYYDPRLRPLLLQVRRLAAKSDLPGTAVAASVFLISGSIFLWLYHEHILSHYTMEIFVFVIGIVSYVPLRIAAKTGDQIRNEILFILDLDHKEEMERQSSLRPDIASGMQFRIDRTLASSLANGKQKLESAPKN